MPRFAANLSTMFQEVAFEDRFAVAADAGFAGVEIQFPYAVPAERLADRRAAAGVEQVLINLPPGDLEAGDRGLAAVPGREAEFADALTRALDYAQALECKRLHAMAGIVAKGENRDRVRRTFIANLALAADAAAARGIDILIEPINLRDVPGYFLVTQGQAHAIVAEVGASNLAVQMDLYHCQVTEGDLSRRLERHIGGVGHIQIAGVPDRQEPDRGEVAYPHLFSLIDELGYRGWIGCEYTPRATTLAGLDWIRPWL